jgi:hypothetical protein
VMFLRGIGRQVHAHFPRKTGLLECWARSPAVITSS